MISFSDLRYEIKSAWQRVTRGYDDSAVWGHDCWFLENVPKMLRDLSKIRGGAPTSYFQRTKGLSFVELNALSNEEISKLESDFNLEVSALADEFDGILASYDDLDSKVKQERISAAMAKYAKMFMYLWD